MLYEFLVQLMGSLQLPFNSSSFLQGIVSSNIQYKVKNVRSNFAHVLINIFY